MSDARPRSVIFSEIVQLLLLLEPISRAVQMDSAAAVIGTSVLCLGPAALIILATRGKKVWARDVLAGFAVISVFGFVLAPWFKEMAQFANLRAVLVVFINLGAVGMLFSGSAETWFFGSN